MNSRILGSVSYLCYDFAKIKGRVAELADALGSGPSALKELGGSNPPSPTTYPDRAHGLARRYLLPDLILSSAERITEVDDPNRYSFLPLYSQFDVLCVYKQFTAD